MGWFGPNAGLREDLGELLYAESKSGLSELNSMIELLNDGCCEVEEEEQPKFALCMLEQIREGADYLEKKIREKFDFPTETRCEECDESRELREFDGMQLCVDCIKLLQSERGEG